MNTALIVTIAQYAIKYGIPAAQELIKLFKKADPTVEDWEKVFDLSKKSYEDYVNVNH